MSDFSANLKGLRKQANMSQDSLAEQLSVSRQTVSSWERGKSYPDLDMLVRYCEADEERYGDGNSCYIGFFRHSK